MTVGGVDVTVELIDVTDVDIDTTEVDVDIGPTEVDMDPVEVDINIDDNEFDVGLAKDGPKVVTVLGELDIGTSKVDSDATEDVAEAARSEADNPAEINAVVDIDVSVVVDDNAEVELDPVEPEIDEGEVDTIANADGADVDTDVSCDTIDVIDVVVGAVGWSPDDTAGCVSLTS